MRIFYPRAGFWLSAGLALLSACAQPAATSQSAANQQAVIRGHIEHPTGPQVQLSVHRHALRPDTLSARLDAQGNFRLAVGPLAEPAAATFSDGNEIAYLFLEPGDDLHLALNTKQFAETLVF